MSDVLLQIGATKLVLSTVLACAAWMVHRRARLPGVAYPMWLLVLAILLVPAFMPISVFPAAATADAGLELATAGSAEPARGPASYLTAVGSWFDSIDKRGLVMVWLFGTAALLGWSLWRAVRFRRTLTQALEPAPPELQRQAARIGRRLGLGRVPEIHTTPARISPMVWWTGGRVRVLIPHFLLAELSDEEVRSILAHELAHVRRRDYLVRWLECAACSVFWWNPAAWWSSRRLRAAEEACCDALVPAAAQSSPRSYASALLRVVDAASESPILRTPVIGSPAGGLGQSRTLERRLRMITEGNTTTAPRWMRTAAGIAAICALPLGIVYCGQPDTPATPDGEATEAAAIDANDDAQAGDGDDASRTRGTARMNQFLRELRASVAAGEITAEQARQRASRARQRMEAAVGAAAGDRASSDRPSEGDRSERINQALRELRTMLEAGEITEEQYRERLAGIQRRIEAMEAARGRDGR